MNGKRPSNSQGQPCLLNQTKHPYIHWMSCKNCIGKSSLVNQIIFYIFMLDIFLIVSFTFIQILNYIYNVFTTNMIATTTCSNKMISSK